MHELVLRVLDIVRLGGLQASVPHLVKVCGANEKNLLPEVSPALTSAWHQTLGRIESKDQVFGGLKTSYKCQSYGCSYQQSLFWRSCPSDS